MIRPLPDSAGGAAGDVTGDRAQPMPETPDQLRPEDTNAGDTHVDLALRWAIDTRIDPAMASANWLAADIDESADSAEELLTKPSVSLLQLRKAKSAFKTMRIVGETSSDRRVGARLYAAAIAAGLTWHGRRISRQSDAALERAFNGLLDDTSMPKGLRELAGKALCILREMPC